LEIAKLRALLAKHHRVALDTCIFIYQWEAHPVYSRLTDYIFSSLEQSDFVALTSTVTMTELLVHPYRDEDLARAHDLLSLLSNYPNLEWVSPSLEIAVCAAELRARYRLATPDAVQAATAMYANATAMLTNDPAFKRVPSLEILHLDDYV
jgi:predicted nucleic acid-binding protein